MSADRWVGCLVGQCLGDALGFLVEGQPSELCAHFVATALRGNGVLDGWARGSFRFGQYSDDSQLARELLESYVACGRLDPADYARRVAALFSEGRIVGRGRATEQAAQRLAAGVDWQEAGEPAPQAGNGSAMRAAPVGLIHAGDFDALVQAAHDQGRITHQDPRCSAGAAAIAGAVAIALRGPVDPDALVAELAAHVEKIARPFGQFLAQLSAWRTLAPAAAFAAITTTVEDTPARSGWRGISPYVVPSVLWSLYAFLRSPDDYWETVCTAIAVGGDVDTTAAMAGAISGAHLGAAVLPRPLTVRLNDQGTWGLAELTALAERAHALASGG